MSSARLRSLILFLALPAFLLTAGLGCKAPDQATLERSKPVQLNYWRVFDDEDAIRPLIAAYQALHPNVTVNFKRLRYDEYEQAALDALAEDRGPDILSLHNDWLGRWESRLLPAPASLSIAFREEQGTIKKEFVWSIKTVAAPTPKQVKNDFADVVATDVIIPTPQTDPRMPLVDRVYGLPLALDTLVLYFNRDILNAAGIASPAAQWQEFQDHVKKITRLDETGAILNSGAAIGTSTNVNRSADLLAALMMQNGAPMTDPNGVVSFDKLPADMTGRTVTPGAEALVFYTDFANPEKEVYTWNDNMPNSLQAFIKGQTAYYFGYAYDLPTIRNSGIPLNFGIAAFPQIQGNKPVNLANYWVETVSKKTKYPNEAWDFLQFITKADQVQRYLAKAKKPTALRSLVNTQLEDLDLSTFASQVLSAKSWYHGADPFAAEKAMNEMIRGQLAAEADTQRLLEIGAAKINQTVK